MNHLTQIDPIGESLTDETQNNEQLEHDLICNTGTAINRMKLEITNLNEMIEDYASYSSNTFFVTKLKNLKQRMLNQINDIDKNFNDYVDYNTEEI